jgi:hypothetical protein
LLKHEPNYSYTEDRTLSRGALQSLVLAHMWFNIASANGGEDAPSNRDSAENLMTRDQIAEARALARVCMSSDYQECE